MTSTDYIMKTRSELILLVAYLANELVSKVPYEIDTDGEEITIPICNWEKEDTREGLYMSSLNQGSNYDIEYCTHLVISSDKIGVKRMDKPFNIELNYLATHDIMWLVEELNNAYM